MNPDATVMLSDVLRNPVACLRRWRVCLSTSGAECRLTFVAIGACSGGYISHGFVISNRLGNLHAQEQRRDDDLPSQHSDPFEARVGSARARVAVAASQW